MIQVRNLMFRYPEQKQETVKGISFTIPQGSVFGFLGPSGAGKTTTQKILLGLLTGYRGEILCEGRPFKTDDSSFYESVGAAFEFPTFYTRFTARENLRFFGSLYQNETMSRVEPLLERLGLASEAHKRVSEFSKGMKMRLNLIRALLHSPDLIFLDEPTSGLDPVNARNVLEIVKEQREQGKTIFLTTHNMQTAAELCDTVAFMVDGQIKQMDTPRSLMLQHGEESLEVEFRDGSGSLHSRKFPMKDLGANTAFLQLIKQVEPERIHTLEASLDDVFIKTTGRSLL